MEAAIKKFVSFTTVLTMLSSMTVLAENNGEETIVQFSPYKIATGNEERVEADFAASFANVDLSSSSWTNNLLRGGSTGSYNGGMYLYSQGDNTRETITVTIQDVPYGVYTVNQFDVAAPSAPMNITIESESGNNEYTTSPETSGAFKELGTGVELGGTVTIVYQAASSEQIRLDETQLVMTESLPEPEKPSDLPTASPTDKPTAPPEEPTSKPLPSELPDDISESTVSGVELTGQFVAADNLAGLAVGGECEVSYTFSSVNGAQDNGAKIQWYKSLTKDGEYTAVEGGDSSPYVIPEELGGYYVKAGVSVLTDENKMTAESYSEPMQVKYRLGFYDDFNYTAESGEDPAFIEHGWTSDKSIRVLGSPTVYCARVPENITVEDGKLKITTRKEHLDKYSDIDYAGHPHTWTTGSIWTTEGYGPYGVFDASYKLTEATGLNQSFWAMVRQPATVENGFVELDFNEGHYPYEMATNVHRVNNSVTVQNSIKHYPLGNSEGSETLADNFNRYTAMLKPNNDSYTWDSAQNSDTYQVYFNNEIIRKTKSLQYTASPVSIFFSVAVYPGTFTGPLVDEDADNSVMEADWVAFYEFLGVTKAELEAEILKAEEYVNNAVVGTEKGQYAQESVDALSAVIESTKSVLESNPDSGALSDALDRLKDAEGTFLRSVVGGYYVNVESISFEEKEVTMLVEKTKQLNVLFTPSDANNKDVTYSSSKQDIASVDANGLVTAKSAGTTVITATSKDGGYQAQCTVTVTNLPEDQVFYEVTGGKLIFDKSSQSIIDYVGSPTEIVIPSRIDDVKVLSIAINTFKNLTSLKTLRIKKGLESIGDWSFVDCTSLETVQLPESLISINYSAFQGCSSLKEIIIPSSVRNMEIGAFTLCPNLEKVIFNGNVPEIVNDNVFDKDTVTIYFYTGAEGFTAPEWKGYKSVQLDGEPIPVPEPVLTEIRIGGGRDTAIRGFTMSPLTAKAYDDIGDEITDIDFIWSVDGKASIDGSTVTISENARTGDIIKVKAEAEYNGKTMSAEKNIMVTDTLLFDFGNEYIKTKPFLPGSMPETEIADTGITTTVKVSSSSTYSNVEIMNVDTKTQSGYYPYKNGLPGDFYYLFISGKGTNTLKLPYTARAGETIRMRFAKPYATNNGTKNRSENNDTLEVKIGNETYSLQKECDFDKWYTKDFVVSEPTDTITITMGTWSAIAIENIEVIPVIENIPETEPDITDVSVNGKNVTVHFNCESGVIIAACYDDNGVLSETHIAEQSSWQKDGDGYTAEITLNNEYSDIKCMLWDNLENMRPQCESK